MNRDHRAVGEHRATSRTVKDHGSHRDESHGLHLSGRRAVVVIVSSSAARGAAQDLCGPVLHEWLAGLGLSVDPVRVIADGPDVEATLRELTEHTPRAERPRFIVTSGGTGLNSDDVTPEATARILERQSPGIMYALWAEGLAKTPTAVMSRGVAGHTGMTFVVNLPGSKGGVKDGMAVLEPLLDHISAQLEDVHGHGDPRGTGPSESSGGAPTAVRDPAVTSGVLHAHITTEPLDAARAQDAVTAAECGAVVGFSGVIRDHDGGRTGVTGLEYSAHPDADTVMRQVAEEIAAQFPGVRIWAEHRIGALVVGDSALEAAVASAHRKEAFTACDALVDRIKARVPIWKRQTYTDGTHSWVGLDG
ncbi:molybdenum cofactor biosynthesis protein MoaE [Kocuria sp. cx-455]|uniref:molybdenum cofactor biosynthesis protein MoaE n=1 Tax=Kocuria sp. cx-455 TaxID=2771377 RepID=UPI002804A089|nr:molybdenum cofactor biosynthesis protein MoaE [Kocuria sp. cx-455]